MTFSLPRRRTKVLREGKKRSKQCQNRTRLDALYDFINIDFKSIILHFISLLRILLFLCVYRKYEVLKNISFSALLFYFIIRLFLNFFLAYFIKAEENEAYCYKSCKKNCNPFCNTCYTLCFKVNKKVGINKRSCCSGK